MRSERLQLQGVPRKKKALTREFLEPSQVASMKTTKYINVASRRPGLQGLANKLRTEPITNDSDPDHHRHADSSDHMSYRCLTFIYCLISCLHFA